MHHTDELLGYIHGPVQWSYANAAARTGASGFVAADVTQRKCCVQTDNNTMWMLTAVTPTWSLISASGISGDVSINTTTGATTVTDLTIASEAAGDVLYFDGTNWKRLAKDAGKYLKSGASAVSWDTPAGGGAKRVFSASINGVLYASTSVYLGYWQIPEACTLSDVVISVDTAPTGADLIVDVHYHATAIASATTIFTTTGNRPTIAAGGFQDTSGTPDVTSVAALGYLTFYVDQIGSTIPGSNLNIMVRTA